MRTSHETRYVADGSTLTTVPRKPPEEGEIVEKTVGHPARRIRMRVLSVTTRELGWMRKHTVEVEVVDADDPKKQRQSTDMGGGATRHREADGSEWIEY